MSAPAALRFLSTSLGARTCRSRRDAFELLANADKLDPALAASLKGTVGFCNVAVHDDTRLDLAIVQATTTS